MMRRKRNIDLFFINLTYCTKRERKREEKNIDNFYYYGIMYRGEVCRETHLKEICRIMYRERGGGDERERHLMREIKFSQRNRFLGEFRFNMATLRKILFSLLYSFTSKSRAKAGRSVWARQNTFDGCLALLFVCSDSEIHR